MHRADELLAASIPPRRILSEGVEQDRLKLVSRGHLRALLTEIALVL
jgi:hypothetical protein